MSDVQKFMSDLLSGARWDVGVGINRSNALPLDPNSVFETKAEAELYAKKYEGSSVPAGRLKNSYVSQILTVLTPTVSIYYIDENYELQEVGRRVEVIDLSSLSANDFTRISREISSGDLSILVKNEENYTTLTGLKYYPENEANTTWFILNGTWTLDENSLNSCSVSVTTVQLSSGDVKIIAKDYPLSSFITMDDLTDETFVPLDETDFEDIFGRTIEI